MKIAIGRKPSAWVPVVMSLCALTIAVVVIEIDLFTQGGVAPVWGAGAAAHLWQLMMWAQIPVIACFAFRWVRRAPWQAVAAASAAVLPVLILGW
jgi:hypothetical protein